MLREDRWLKVLNFFWGLILLTLPVTSFRYFPAFFGRAIVQPLALYPLAVLIPLFLLYLWKRKELPLPLQSVPIAAFLLVAFGATVLGGVKAPLDLGSATYWERAARAWSTLGAALLFFFVSFGVAYYQKSFNKPIKWLYAGLVLSLIWGGIQAVAVNTNWIDRNIINEIQLSFSLRPLQFKRVSGFAYEPAWLAHSLTILYFSWLVASIISGYRISRYKWLEPVLAAAGFVILLTTLSRGGVFNTLVTGVIVFVIAGFDRIKKGYLWFISPFRSGGQGSKWLRFAIVIGIVVIIASVFWYLNNSIYFSSLWGERLRGGLLKYLLANRVGSRLAYVYSGFGTFSLHPWTGVGLGGSGFYMMEYYPNWAFSVPEVELATQFGEIFRVVPNPKNLYIRLLAETGLVGFWLYLTMLFSMLGSFYRRLKRGDLISRYIGTAGLFGWIAAVMTSFVQDSFAVPFSWVLLGMCLGFDRSLQKTEEGKQV